VKMKYKYLLFDADNTLFDFRQAEQAAFRETCDAVGIQWSSEGYSAYSNINERLWKELEFGRITVSQLKLQRYEEFLSWCGCQENLKILAEKMRDVYGESLGKQTFLMPQAVDVCQKLSEKYPLYIITNGIAAVQKKRMAASVLQPYFKKLYISEEIGVAKPAAAFFDYVLSDIGDPVKAHYLVIGDSLTSDIDGAIGAGIDACWLSAAGADTKGRSITYTIPELSSLLSIV